jgi:maleylacetoacetate isomerase
MAKAILYDYWRSSASYRVRIALNLKRVDYERVAVDLLAGDQRGEAHLTRNPQGFVPALLADGRMLTQSLAIIDYLDAAVPAPPFVPRDPADRAHVLALALTVACDIHPLNNLRVLKRLGAMGIEQPARDDWYRHWVKEGLDALEALAAPRAGLFLFGDSPGLADICLVPQLYNARRFEVPLDAYPALLRADASAGRLDAFITAHPDRVAPPPPVG